MQIHLYDNDGEDGEDDDNRSRGKNDRISNKTIFSLFVPFGLLLSLLLLAPPPATTTTAIVTTMATCIDTQQGLFVFANACACSFLFFSFLLNQTRRSLLHLPLVKELTTASALLS